MIVSIFATYCYILYVEVAIMLRGQHHLRPRQQPLWPRPRRF